MRNQGSETAVTAPLRVRTFITSDPLGAVHGRPDTLRQALDTAARERAAKLVDWWQENVAQAPGAGGIHNATQPLSWDSLMDQMEAAAIGFDEDGQPTMKIVAGPDAPELGEPSERQRTRMIRLLERKREEYRDRRRRRLVP